MQDVLAKYKPDTSIFDPLNPCSLLNVAPENFIPLINQIMDRMPKLMVYPDILLRSHCKPDERDDRLRLSFWDEYNMATAQVRRMTLRNVIHKVCPVHVWNSYYENDLHKVLWIITAPRDYNHALRTIHAHGMERLDEIMKMPMKDASGKMDYKAVALLLKTFQLVDLRVKGAILQRVQIQQQNLNFNAEVTQDQIKNLSELSVDQLEAMERKIEKLQRLEQKVLDIPAEHRADALELEAKIKELDPTDATLAPFNDDELLHLDRDTE